MGIAVAIAIITAHWSVTSVVHRNCLYTCVPHLTTETKTKENRMMRSHCPIMENLSVLVLDHNPVSLLTISKTLAKFNFKVLPFQTAEAALDSLKSGVSKDEEFDLVLAEVHLGNTAEGTSALFHHILNKLEAPLITMCAYNDEEAVSECMSLGACFHVLKPLNTGTFIILKQKALQHRSRRVITEGSSILSKTKSNKKLTRRFILESSNVDGSETEEDEEPDVWKAHGYSKKPGRFSWNNELHEKFLQAVEVLGESATPGRIRRQMNVKGVTKQQIASHLQKHRLREQRIKQGQNQWNASIKPASQLRTSVYNAATSKPINQLTTTEMLVTPRVAAATWEYPRRLCTQVEKSPADAAASKTLTRTAAIFGDDTKSVWDKYHKSLQYQKNLQKEFSAYYRRKLLPVKSKAVTKHGGIANIALNAAGEKGYGRPVSAPLENSASNSILASLIQQLEENSRTEAAGNNGNLENVGLYEGTVNSAADGLVDLESNALLDGTNSYPTAEMGLSDPFCGWEEVDTFWRVQLEGSQEQQDLAPDDLLQVNNAWNDALQPAIPANVDDAPTAQEPATGDALAYDPAQQFTIGEAIWSWSPQVVDDFDML